MPDQRDRLLTTACKKLNELHYFNTVQNLPHETGMADLLTKVLAPLGDACFVEDADDDFREPFLASLLESSDFEPAVLDFALSHGFDPHHEYHGDPTRHIAFKAIDLLAVDLSRTLFSDSERVEQLWNRILALKPDMNSRLPDEESVANAVAFTPENTVILNEDLIQGQRDWAILRKIEAYSQGLRYENIQAAHFAVGETARGLHIFGLQPGTRVDESFPITGLRVKFESGNELIVGSANIAVLNDHFLNNEDSGRQLVFCFDQTPLDAISPESDLDHMPHKIGALEFVSHTYRYDKQLKRLVRVCRLIFSYAEIAVTRLDNRMWCEWSYRRREGRAGNCLRTSLYIDPCQRALADADEIFF